MGKTIKRTILALMIASMFTTSAAVLPSTGIFGSQSVMTVYAEDPTAENVCTIGEVGYETLFDAIKAAKSGDTIVLTSNCEGTGIGLFANPDPAKDQVKIKDLTIDFNNFTYTCTGPGVGSQGTESQALHLEKGCSITLKNGTLKVNNHGTVKMGINNYCNLTLYNFTVDATELNGQYATSNNCGSLTVLGNSSILSRAGDGVAFDLWYGMYQSYYGGVSVYIDTTGTISGTMEYGAQNTPEGWREKTKLTIKNGNFTGNIAASSTDALNGASISISGGTFSSDVSQYCVVGKTTEQQDNDTYKVVDVKADDDAIKGTIKEETNVGKTTGAVSSNIAENDKTDAQNAAESVNTKTEASNINITKEKGGDVIDSQVKADAAAALKNLGADLDDKEVTFNKTVSFNVTATDYKKTANNTSDSISLDISPVLTLTATADNKTVTVRENQPVEVNSSVKLSVKLPTTIAQNNKPVYVTHETKNKGSVVYTSTDADENGNISFDNPDGFSSFTFSAENPAVASIGTIGYLTLENAIKNVTDGGTVTILRNGLTATVSGNKTFTLDVSGDVTAPTLTAADGYELFDLGSNTYEVAPVSAYVPEIDISTITVTKKDGWNKSGTNWYVYQDGVKVKGWYRDGNTWYYLDTKNGRMSHSGLQEIDGKTYYFYSWGGMANSFWFLNEETGAWYFFGGDGAMKQSAWVEWKGEYYYVGTDGVMLTSTTTPDGYKVDASGKWVK